MNKITVAFLLLVVAAAFSAFRGSPVKVNRNNVSASSSSSLGIPDIIHVEAKPANTILQSRDGGQTWQDISAGLPMDEQPEDFFAGASDLYLRIGNEMYRSRSNLKTPLWEKEFLLDPESTSIVFNRSGVMAYSYGGSIYRRMTSVAGWSPVYTNFGKGALNNVLEASDGSVFVSCASGLYKSSNAGQSWKQVLNDGSVRDLVEDNGVIVGIGQKGVIRSGDNGEHWEWVVSEGGVGIEVERIDGGFAAIVYNTEIQARMILLSMDAGKTWEAIDQGLRPASSISSIQQIGRYLVVGHPDGIFRSADMGKTWNIVHLNAEPMVNFGGKPSKVFKLYVSGNVMYAVARGAGC